MLAASSLKTLTRLGDWVTEERALPGPPWPLNAILLAVLAVSPLLLAALTLDEVTALFWLILIADLVLLFAVAVATFRMPALFIAIIILWFALQRLVVALVAPHVSADLVRLLLTYKEGFYLILLASGVLSVSVRHFRGERALPAVLAVDMIAIAFLAWLAVVFIADPRSSSEELTYLRRFAAPILLYLGGRLLIARRDQLVDSARLLVAVAVAVAAFGLIERFVFDITFWRDTVEASTFYGKQVESGLLPPNWTVIYRGVPDGIFIAMPLEVPVRRLVSTYLEPTTLSSLLALALLLLVLVPDLVWRQGGPLSRGLVAVASLSLGVAVVATLSRGGMVTFVAATLFVLGVRWLRTPSRKFSVPQPMLLVPLLALIGLGAALTTFADVPARESVRDVLSTRAVSGLSDEPAPSEPQPTSPAPSSGPLDEIEVHPPGSTADAASKHLRGLTSGLEEMVDHPVGRGLGATGNWSRQPGTANESTVGVIAAQLGVFGLALYVAFFATVVTSLIAAGWSRDGFSSDFPLVLAGAMLGLFIVSCVSESASGLLGNAFYLLFAGWALSVATPARDAVRWRLLPDSEGADRVPLDAPAARAETEG